MSGLVVFPGWDEQHGVPGDAWYRFEDVRKVELEQWAGGRVAVYALVLLGPTLARVLVHVDDEEAAVDVFHSFLGAWVGASGDPWPRVWGAL